MANLGQFTPVSGVMGALITGDFGPTESRGFTFQLPTHMTLLTPPCLNGLCRMSCAFI